MLRHESLGQHRRIPPCRRISPRSSQHILSRPRIATTTQLENSSPGPSYRASEPVDDPLNLSNRGGGGGEKTSGTAYDNTIQRRGQPTDTRDSSFRYSTTTNNNPMEPVRRRRPLQQPAPRNNGMEATDGSSGIASSGPINRSATPHRQSSSSSNFPTAEIEQSPTPRISDIKLRLWDQHETLQVSVPPSIQGAEPATRNPEQRLARSLSPGSRKPTGNETGTSSGPFKSKFYHAAIAAKQREQSPKRAETTTHDANQSYTKSKEYLDRIELDRILGEFSNNPSNKSTPERHPKELRPPLHQSSNHRAYSQSPKRDRGVGAAATSSPPTTPARKTQAQFSGSGHSPMSPSQGSGSNGNKNCSPQVQPRSDSKMSSTSFKDALAQSDDTLAMTRNDMATLVSRLHAVNRTDPKLALAQIDSILAAAASAANLARQQRNVATGQPATRASTNGNAAAVRVGQSKQDQEESSSSDDDTSVSSITNPTYQSGLPHPDHIHDDVALSTSGFRRPRPSALHGYSTSHGAPLSSSKSKKTRSPPPATIKISGESDNNKKGAEKLPMRDMELTAIAVDSTANKPATTPSELATTSTGKTPATLPNETQQVDKAWSPHLATPEVGEINPQRPLVETQITTKKEQGHEEVLVTVKASSLKANDEKPAEKLSVINQPV